MKGVTVSLKIQAIENFLNFKGKVGWLLWVKGTPWDTSIPYQRASSSLGPCASDPASR